MAITMKTKYLISNDFWKLIDSASNFVYFRSQQNERM